MSGQALVDTPAADFRDEKKRNYKIEEPYDGHGKPPI
jgi:hypothetical protein